jgi:hypothetical protein
MEAIEAIALAGGAGFAIVVVATIVVIIGVRHEEHLGTLTRQHPPTIPALLARLVLRTHIRLPTGQHNEQDFPSACRCPNAAQHRPRRKESNRGVGCISTKTMAVQICKLGKHCQNQGRQRKSRPPL